jgi:hypothetical protein
MSEVRPSNLSWDTEYSDFFRGLPQLASCFLLVSCLAYSSTVKMEVVRSSETSLEFYWATWC